MKTVTLTFSTKILASQKTIFNYVSDWEKQSDWILFTSVHTLTDSANGQNPILLATTKFGPLKVIDTMVIIDWQPYERIVVEHTGRVVLGKGVFTVRKISDDSCEFIWQEITPVPFGFVGRIGLLLVKPFMKVLFDRSLKKLKFIVESL